LLSGFLAQWTRKPAWAGHLTAGRQKQNGKTRLAVRELNCPA
jgi:hypothetical protein